MPLTDPAPGKPTRLAQLIELGRKVDYSQHPTLADLPAAFAGLIYQDLIEPAVEKADPDAVLADVQEAVSHAISPPDPNAASGRTFKGVDPEAYNSLKAELEQLRAEFSGLKAKSTVSTIDPLAELKAQVAELKTETAAPAPAAPAEQAPDALSRVTDPQEAELLNLRQQLQQLQIQQAAGQHPTAESISEDES